MPFVPSSLTTTTRRVPVVTDASERVTHDEASASRRIIIPSDVPNLTAATDTQTQLLDTVLRTMEAMREQLRCAEERAAAAERRHSSTPPPASRQQHMVPVSTSAGTLLGHHPPSETRSTADASPAAEMPRVRFAASQADALSRKVIPSNATVISPLQQLYATDDANLFPWQQTDFQPWLLLSSSVDPSTLPQYKPPDVFPELEEVQYHQGEMELFSEMWQAFMSDEASPTTIEDMDANL